MAVYISWRRHQKYDVRMYVYMYNIVSWSIDLWKESVIIPMYVYFEWIYGKSLYLFHRLFIFDILIFHIPIHFYDLY